MKISFVSDLHLEFGQYPHILEKTEKGDVCILAGDINVAAYFREGRNDPEARKAKKIMEHLRKDVCDKFDHVYYIMGNHEHYRSIYKTTVDTMKNYFKGSNVTVCDTDTFTHGDITLIGTTLWSDFMGENPLSMNVVQSGLNDYYLIGMRDVSDLNYFNKNESHTITADFILNEHKKMKDFIDLAAKNNKNQKCVVFTHHGPTYQSINRMHSDDVLDGGYCSNLENMMFDNPNIKYWIHGHTHYNVEYDVGNCRVIANQFGYRHENTNRNFTGLRTIEV